MKRSFVFIFIFLLSLSLLLFSCSSDTGNNESSGSSYTKSEFVMLMEAIMGGSSNTLSGSESGSENESTGEKISVTGINIAGTYIELYKKDGVELYYNISATVIPDNATNKTLLYTSSDESIATVSGDGILTIRDVGDFEVTIQSEEIPEIYQIVYFSVIESELMNLDIENNPLSLYGAYIVTQYGINGAPDTNINGNFTINANKDNDDIVSANLLFNGLSLSLDIEADDISNSVSYEDIARSLYSYFDVTLDNDSSIIMKLKANDHSSLIDCGLLSSGQTLQLRLRKEYNITPGEIINLREVSVTQIQVTDNITIDRLEHTAYTISPQVLPVNAKDKSLSYASDNESVLTISSIGVVSILNEGEANITITSNSNEEISKQVKFTVIDSTVEVTDISFKIISNSKEISVSDGEYTLYVDDYDETYIKAVIYPEDATYQDVVYSSSDTFNFQINEATGEITFIRQAGEYIVTATADKGKISKSIILNVEGFKQEVTAILLPDHINMAINSEISITPRAYPRDAQDSELICESNDDKLSIINNDGECIISAGSTVGEAIVTVSALYYPDITDEMTIRIRQDEKEITIDKFTFDTSDVSLYAGYTDYTFEPTYYPTNANVEHYLSVKSSDTSIIRVMDNGDGTYAIIPTGEIGEAEVTVTSENGLTATKKFIVKQVMEIQGYYRVTQAKYTYGSTSVTFSSSNNTKNFQGEFVIALNESSYKYNVQGRLQLTPSEPLKYYMFNNWRYIYENKDISLDSSDIYAGQTKEGLKSGNISVTGSRTLEYTYTDSSFSAVISLEKVSDSTKDISDRTMYMTDVDMINDPHSIEGYYEINWFYGNPYTANYGSINPYRYQPLFSNSPDDRPTDSDISISYLNNNQWCWFIKCKGGEGDNGSVAYYKGAFAINVEGTGENANVSSIVKTQMNGHAALGWSEFFIIFNGGDSSRKYVHATFEPVTLSQSTKSSGYAGFRATNTYYVYGIDNNGSGSRVSAYIAYRDYTNTKDSSKKNIVRLEHQFWTTHQFMYRAEKVSDRYVDLSTDKFVDGDLGSSSTPDKPDAVVIEEIEELGGTVTDIE